MNKLELNKFVKDTKFGSWCNHCKYCEKAIYDYQTICNSWYCLAQYIAENIRRKREINETAKS